MHLKDPTPVHWLEAGADLACYSATYAIYFSARISYLLFSSPHHHKETMR